MVSEKLQDFYDSNFHLPVRELPLNTKGFLKGSFDTKGLFVHQRPGLKVNFQLGSYGSSDVVKLVLSDPGLYLGQPNPIPNQFWFSQLPLLVNFKSSALLF